MTNKNLHNTRFSIRVKTLLFALLVLLVLILHYPMGFNEVGWDSFLYHILANSLSEFGYAKWWIHSLSVFGMYPYSVGGALPFLLSGWSQTIGFSTDKIIFWFSLLIGILAIFTSYLFARTVFNDDIYKFIVAFGFSTSQSILFYTTWTAGTRALFIIMLPLFLYTIMKLSDSRKYVILSTILFITLMATHKLYFFILPVIFCWILVHSLYSVKPFWIREHYKLFIFILVFGFLVMFFIPFFSRTFITVGSRYTWLSDILITYVRYNGIALLIFVSGFIYIMFDTKKTKEQVISLISFVALAPFFNIMNYMKWFIVPFLFFFAGRGLTNILTIKSHKKLNLIISILLIFAIVIFTSYFQFIHFYLIETPVERNLDKSEYVAGMWLKEFIPNEFNMVCTNSYLGRRIFSISQIPTMIGSDTIDITYEFVNTSSVITERISMMNMNTYFDSPYVQIRSGPKTIWYIENTFSRYHFNDKHIKGAVENFNFSYLIEDSKRPSTFTRSLEKETDAYYDNGNLGIWLL